VKYYDSLKVVYQIQTILQEWQQQDAEQPRLRANRTAASRTKLPVASPEQSDKPDLKR
jgi:hypothetical protein